MLIGARQGFWNQGGGGAEWDDSATRWISDGSVTEPLLIGAGGYDKNLFETKDFEYSVNDYTNNLAHTNLPTDFNGLFANLHYFDPSLPPLKSGEENVVSVRKILPSYGGVWTFHPGVFLPGIPIVKNSCGAVSKILSVQRGVKNFIHFFARTSITELDPDFIRDANSLNRAFSNCARLMKMIPWPPNVTNVEGCYENCTAISLWDENATDEELMPARITQHFGCVTGCPENVRARFYKSWGGTRPDPV